jgi:hypothetical protein
MQMKIIYANIAWYAVTVFGLFGAAIFRHNSADWEGMSYVRISYDIVYGLLALYLIICTIGLILKRKWGYIFAVSANATLTLVPMAIFFASLIMVLPALNFLSLLKINMTNLLYGIISLSFLILLIRLRGNGTYFDK